MAISKARHGMVLQIWSYPGPQGFRFRHHNPSGRELADYEGLILVRKLEKVTNVRVAANLKMAAFTKKDDEGEEKSGGDEMLITE